MELRGWRYTGRNLGPDFHRQIRIILDRLEEAVAADYNTVQLDASLPAVHLYERRGYHTVEHQSEGTESGCVLVWDVMEKRLRED